MYQAIYRLNQVHRNNPVNSNNDNKVFFLHNRTKPRTCVYINSYKEKQLFVEGYSDINLTIK